MGKTSPFLLPAREAARAADDKKALDVNLFDLRRSSAVAEYVLVVTVGSAPQAAAVEDEIDRRVHAAAGLHPLRREGGSRAPWRVLDYGGMVVHLMNPSVRSFYDLERLWESARKVLWHKRPPAAPRSRARSNRRISS
jgi:ribosome-associated protein